ncbi:HAMP domain-containing sensor histidine kinase [Olivibacter ginsenosidimutans]|uniref:histidine kinase n=1 Tax=Olivibacter ginsenosidimutans TaxID=1176537 RepID=A0ABP9AQ23_9SPHI
MTLRLKLAWNTTLIVALILGLTFLGTYILFKQHNVRLFYERLQAHAITAAFFHLEKDELNAQKYQLVEQKYLEIRNESIRFYDKNNHAVFEHDTLNYSINAEVLEQIRINKVYYFSQQDRQFAGIFYRDNEGDFVVVVSAVDHDGQIQLDKLKLYLSLFFLFGLGLGFLLTQLLAKQTFSPFSKLIASVNTITAHNLHARLEIHGREKDELTSLTQAFNLLLERLEKGVNSQQNFLKHASHELKTPLATMISNLEVTLSRDRSNEEYRERMEALYTDALHINAIVEGLLLLSGLEASQDIQLTPTRIDELLWDLLEKTSIRYPSAIMEMNLDGMEENPHLLEVLANRDLLMIAIGNLVDNALKFSANQPVTLRLELELGMLRLAIQDQGIGIEVDELLPIFDLFYRSTKDPSIPGHGIGLYLSKQILDLHQIQIRIVPNHPKGTIFYLLFPDYHQKERLF